MKPPPFAYCRAETLDEALATLSEHGDEAKVLAGGQSLVPMLNLRLARPRVLVDVMQVPDLLVVERRNGTLALGAAVRQRLAETAPEVVAACPLLPQALRHVGHAQIRARGTIGGSLAHADPAAELAAVALVLDAELVARDRSQSRAIAARDFYHGPWTTALDDDELLVEVRIPVREDLVTTVLEVARRHGDFALGGVAAAARLDAGGTVLAEVRLAAFGVTGTPLRLDEAERVLAGREACEELFSAAAAAASGEIEPLDDHRADARYRRALLGTLVVRALREVTA